MIFLNTIILSFNFSINSSVIANFMDHFGNVLNYFSFNSEYITNVLYRGSQNMDEAHHGNTRLITCICIPFKPQSPHTERPIYIIRNPVLDYTEEMF